MLYRNIILLKGVSGGKVIMRSKFRVLLTSQAVYGVLPVIGASMLAPGALAQADETRPQAKVVDNIVVTASRTEQNVADVPASVEVIGQDEILNTTGVDITDVLKKNASVDVIQYPGGLAGVGLRGFRPEFSGTNKRVLVLIDGRPAGAESMGNIATAGIARIEVLKGSASSIYGASAMGGVVNYITRKSDGELGGSVNVGYGSYDTVKLGARFGGAISDRINVDLALTHLAQHDDFKLGSGGETFGAVVQGNGAVRPNTEFVNNNIYARAAVRLVGDWEAQVRFLGFDGPDTETPGAESDGTSDQADKEESNFGGDVSVTGSIGNHDLLALYYMTKEEQSFFDKPPGQVEFLSSTNDIDWMGVQLQDNWALGENFNIILGADYQLVEESTGFFNADNTPRGSFSPDYERETWGVFVDLTARLFNDRLILNAGGRYDEIETTTLPTLGNNRTFEPGKSTLDTFNPRAGFVFRPDPDGPWRLHASAGTGFVVPDPREVSGFFEQVVGSQLRITEGNPGLEPEESESYDIGVAYDGRLFGMDVTLFKLDVENRISSVLTTNTPDLRITTFENASGSTAEGLESQAWFDFGGLLGGREGVWLADSSLTYYFTREEELSAGPSTIRNVAEFKINFGVGYDDGVYSARLSGRHVQGAEDRDFSAGRIFTNGAGGQFQYPDFTVLDFTAGWQITDANRLSVKLDNITDKYYFEKNDFPFRGRNFLFEYRHDF